MFERILRMKQTLNNSASCVSDYLGASTDDIDGSTRTRRGARLSSTKIKRSCQIMCLLKETRVLLPGRWFGGNLRRQQLRLLVRDDQQAATNRRSLSCGRAATRSSRLAVVFFRSRHFFGHVSAVRLATFRQIFFTVRTG